MRVSKELRMEVSGCQPSDRSPGSQKADGKPRGHLLTGRSQKPSPGPQAAERWLRVEHACWLRRDSCGPSQAWLRGAHPASTPCWLAGLYLSCVFSTSGKLLRLCPTLCDYMDCSLLKVLLSSSDFDYISKGLFGFCPCLISPAQFPTPGRAPYASVCHILVSESPGEQ